MSPYTAHHRSFVPGPHRVVVWEPQAPGGEGSAVNAALLIAAGLAFPQARLAFVSAGAHGAAVRACLPKGALPESAPVEWTSIEVGAAAAAGLRRPYGAWRAERTWFARARALAEAFEAELVLLASVTALGLLAWSGLRADRDPPALVIVHGQGGGPLRRTLLRWAVRVPALDVGASVDGAPAFTPEAFAEELQRLAHTASRSATNAAASNGRGA